MARQTFPRRQEVHEQVGGEILRRHAQTTGWTVSMPVPIELIIEQSYSLTLDVGDIEESAGVTVLGALYPNDRLIRLNERHMSLLEGVIGTMQFTYAHELAHWLYDADPGQEQLFSDDAPTFCRTPGEPDLPEAVRIREMNANKLAASILMPVELMRTLSIDDVVGDIRAAARDLGVSKAALRIRLDELNLLDDLDRDRLM